MTDIASLVVRIGADASQLQSVLGKTERDLKGFGTGFSLQKISDGFSNLASKIMPISVGLAGLGAVGISQASDFEAAMNDISARTGLTGDALENIKNIALDMGAKTAFSSQQAADAFLQLLSSGQSTEEAIATLPSVLDAAAASGMDLGAAADAITDIMSSFGLEAAEAASVANILARASGASSASMSDLTQGFSNVGGVAATFGLSVEDTAAALAVFAENGTKGAEAGTQLKSMLLQLSVDASKTDGAFVQLGVSMYDATGNMRPLQDVIDDLDTALDALPVQEQNRLMLELAGSYGIVGLTALRGGLSIEEMKRRMQDAASASVVAQARMAGFKGRVNSLGGSVEALNIRAFGPFLEKTAGPFVEWLTEGVNAMGVWVQRNPELTQAILEIGTVAAIAGPALAAIGAVLGLIASPVVVVGAAFAAVALAWRENIEGFRDGATLVGEKVSELAGVIGTKIGQIKIGETTIAEIASSISNGLRDAVQRGLDAVSGFFDVDEAVRRAFGAGADVDSERSGIFLTLGSKIAAGLQGAIDGIETLDVNTLNQTIADTISVITFDPTGIGGELQTAMQGAIDGLNAIDITGIQTWATDNFQSILNTIISVAALILGGPISMTIGAAKLISSAIESDFLGIGTFLANSGILTAVQDGFNTLKSQIEGVIQSIFGGGGGVEPIDPTVGLLDSRNIGEAASGGGSMLDRIGQDLAKGLDFIKGIFERVGPGIQTGLETFFGGVQGFFAALQDTDTEGLYEVVRVVGAVLGGILTFVTTAVGQGIETTLTTLGTALPFFGEALSGIIEAIGAIGQGDIGLVLQKLGEAIVNFITGTLTLSLGPIDGIIGFLEKLTGFDLPGVREILDGIGRGFTLLFDNLGRGIKMLVINFQVAGVLAKIALDAITGGSNKEELDAELLGVLSVSRDMRVSDQFTSMLRSQVAGMEPIDLTIPLGYVDIGGGLTKWYGAMSEILDPNNPQFAMLVAGMGLEGKIMVEDALKEAFTIGDQQTITLLQPLAVALGIDVSTIQQNVMSQLFMALDNLSVTINSAITVNPLLQNLSNVISTIRTALANEPLSATVQAMISVSPILSGVTSAISAVVSAITGGGGGEAAADGSHAMGLDYVPFDGYRAILHRGEAVIPASVNRRQGEGQSPVQNVFYLNSYGQSPQEFMEWVKRLMAEGAF